VASGGHLAIDFVARDRGASYGEAASKGAPQAIQVADRWHLVENASAAFLDVVRQHIRAIREVLASTAIDPSVLTKAERRQWDGFQRRQEATDAVLELTSRGTPLKQVVRQLGLARMTVRRIVRGGGTDMFRIRISSLEPHLATLDAQWRDGCRNGAELWRRLRAQGFMGSRRVVAEWTTRRRLDETSGLEMRPRKLLSARQIARLLTIGRDQILREQAYNMIQIERGVPALIAARDLVDRFHAMIRNRMPEELDPWIAAARKAVSLPSRPESRQIVMPSAPHSCSLGQTVRPKAKSPSSNSSNGKCMAGPNSTSSKLVSSAPPE
jgi:transposase